MKLQVENFGPIKKGEIDLSKRFYVFVGYNNSGKTYTANLLWSFFIHNPYLEAFSFFDTIGDTIPNKVTIDEETFLDLFNKFEKNIIENVANDLVINESNSIIINTNIKVTGDHYLKFLNSNIELLTVAHKDGGNKDVYFLKKEKGNDFIQILDQKGNVEPLKGQQVAMTYSSRYNKIEFLNKTIRGAISKIIFNSFKFKQPFFIPANRIFFPSYYKYIYSVSNEEKKRINDKLVKDQVDLDVIKNLSKNPYTKSIEQLIEAYYELGERTIVTNGYEDLVGRIEQLIGGTPISEKIEGIAPIDFKLKLRSGENLDMYLTSSASNQLTSLYLYFKYWASHQGNVLIVDEPESNLHPKNQKALLNILLDFASRNNNKVIITTHSPFLTKTINNHILMAHLQEKEIELNGVQNNEQIFRNFATDDYGIYFFNGEEIINYEVGDYGAYFKDFEEEEEKVSRLSNILKSKVFQMENK